MPFALAGKIKTSKATLCAMFLNLAESGRTYKFSNFLNAELTKKIKFDTAGNAGRSRKLPVLLTGLGGGILLVVVFPPLFSYQRPLTGNYKNRRPIE